MKLNMDDVFSSLLIEGEPSIFVRVEEFHESEAFRLGGTEDIVVS